jgi:phospholipid/cholesterol/gamma-HCH transport system substrate-binding protein
VFGKGTNNMNNRRFNEISMEVIVGAFMFMVLLALGSFTIVLSRQNLFQPTYPINVKFDSVMGLREGDNVYVRGVVVGKIKEIDAKTDGVYLIANLDIPLTFKKDYKIEILPSSVLGGRYLNIYSGTSEAEALPKGELLMGETPVDLVTEATDMINEIRASMTEGGVLKNLEEIMDNLKTLSSKLEQGEGTIGKLLVDNEVYNDIKSVTADFKVVSDRLAKGEGTLGKLSKDDDLYAEVQNLILEAKAMLDDVRETAPITTFTSIMFGAL